MDILKKQLTYQSWHRGTKEMDTILGLFLDDCYEELSKTDVLCYKDFLCYDDDVLYDWICLNVQTVPPIYQDLVCKIKNYHCKRHKHDNF
jgi:antitoxin CptB